MHNGLHDGGKLFPKGFEDASLDGLDQFDTQRLKLLSQFSFNDVYDVFSCQKLYFLHGLRLLSPDVPCNTVLLTKRLSTKSFARQVSGRVGGVKTGMVDIMGQSV
jgi:hypothetical protein